MSKGVNQRKQQKSQPSQSKKITLNESGRSKRSAGAGGGQRFKKGSAADGTNSTGPRKTE